MKIRTYILISLVILLFSCKSKDTYWKTLYESANKEYEAYFMTLSEENYNKAISNYNLLINDSPEYRNKSLELKSRLLLAHNNFDDAVDAIKQIPDTSGVFPPFLTKTMRINDIWATKAFYNLNDVEYKMYKKKIVDEMEIFIEGRRDAIYHTIKSNPIDINYTTNSDIAAFMFYISYLEAYDINTTLFVIKQWEAGVPEPNENSKTFFESIKISSF